MEYVWLSLGSGDKDEMGKETRYFFEIDFECVKRGSLEFGLMRAMYRASGVFGDFDIFMHLLMCWRFG